MSLWTDGLYPTPADVNAEEPALNTALANTCGIGAGTNLTSLCSQAYSLCAQIIASKLQSVVGAANFNPSGGATSLHNGALIWGVRAQSNVVRLRMGQIVMDDLYIGDGASPQSLSGPLHTWLTHWAIVLGYRKVMGAVDASLDRGKIKYDIYYKITAGEKWAILRSTGIPYVRIPLPAPGALYEPGCGLWSTANLSPVSSSGATGGNYKIAITWVDQTSPVFYISPLNKNNSESGPSKVLPIAPLTDGIMQTVIAPNTVLKVDISSLNPPNGSINLAESSITGVSQGTRIATGWNIYMGSVDPGTPMYLQNTTPIPVGTKTYTLPGDPVSTGFTMGRGQYPDANMPMGDLMMRM